MKAVQLLAHGVPGKFELRDLPDPTPAPGEVVIQVRACGLNHLDLWLEAGGLPAPIALPRTPGGEVAGTIAQLGAGLSGWALGDRVAAQSNLFCGECEFCRRGDESLCLRNPLLGVQQDGGFAGLVVVPARVLARLPDAVAFETSAALTLAGSTAMHMLTRRAQVRTGDWVLVMGAASGVGSAAIQIAKGLGARVLTTASSEAKRTLGLSLGAEQVVDSREENWPAEVRRLTAKRGVDWVIEHVGGAVLPKVFECLARGGTVVTCGATAGREVTLNVWPLFVKQQRLVGSYACLPGDLRATLAWAAAGKLKPVVDRIFPLEEVPAALAHLRARHALGKVLVKP